jgi:hypothetical protein
LTPETQEAAGVAPEPMEVAAGEAVATTRGEDTTTLPEPALEVVVRSPEIQDAEPICSASMTEAATSSRCGIELSADDLVDPATVARHLEAVRDLRVQSPIVELSRVVVLGSSPVEGSRQ